MVSSSDCLRVFCLAAFFLISKGAYFFPLSIKLKKHLSVSIWNKWCLFAFYLCFFPQRNYVPRSLTSGKREKCGQNLRTLSAYHSSSLAVSVHVYYMIRAHAQLVEINFKGIEYWVGNLTGPLFLYFFYFYVQPLFFVYKTKIPNACTKFWTLEIPVQ